MLPRQITTTDFTHTRSKTKYMHFNVLADCLTKDAGFAHNTEKSLNWKSRSQMLLDIIANASPDVLSLVECDHYWSFWKRELTKLGLRFSHYAVKGENLHGVAIFSKTPIKLIDKIDTSVAYVLIQLDEFKFVATTHLKAKDAVNTRAEQLSYITESLTKHLVGDRPIIMMGDFNTTLDEPAVAQFVKRFKLNDSNNMPWTTWKAKKANSWQSGGIAKKKIDYILYNQSFNGTDMVDCIVSEDCPTDNVVIDNNYLPGKDYPSDHLAVITTLETIY
jgi:mRNA deadenylase 3'-5' endonuclease subunit Ccr4